jgi:hypothetical protein
MLHQVVHIVKEKKTRKDKKTGNLILMEYGAALLYVRSSTFRRPISAKRQEYYPGMQSHIPERQILSYTAVRTSNLAEKKANILQSTQDTMTPR